MRKQNQTLDQTNIKNPATTGVFIPGLILLISAISFMSPTLMLFFLIIGTVFVLIFLFPVVFSQYSNTTVIVSTLNLLKDLNILSYLESLHFFLFYSASDNLARFIILGTNALSVVYAFVTRYYIYNILSLNYVFDLKSQIFIFCIIYLGICNIYYKILINISIIVINFARNYQSELLSNPILRIPPLDLPDVPQTKGDVPQRNFSLINVNRTSNNYFNPLPKMTGWQKTGIIAACLTCGLAAGSLYYTRLSAIAAQQSAIAAQQSVDLGEVNAGIRTPQSYASKWPDPMRSLDSTVSSPSDSNNQQSSNIASGNSR